MIIFSVSISSWEFHLLVPEQIHHDAESEHSFWKEQTIRPGVEQSKW